MVARRHSLKLYGKDVKRMAPRQLLGDEVINFYMKLLQDRDARWRREVSAAVLVLPRPAPLCPGA